MRKHNLAVLRSVEIIGLYLSRGGIPGTPSTHSWPEFAASEPRIRARKQASAEPARRDRLLYGPEVSGGGIGDRISFRPDSHRHALGASSPDPESRRNFADGSRPSLRSWEGISSAAGKKNRADEMALGLSPEI